jgi:hypothetical protein
MTAILLPEPDLPTPDVAVPDPPALVRGWTATPVNDTTALARLVHQAMCEYPSWAAVDAQCLQVKDVSGAGGSKTFKVWPKEGTAKLTPPAVALHCRPDDHAELFMRRFGAATMAFAAAGCGPRRLAQGQDWFLEEWTAVGKASWNTAEECRKVGECLGRVHQIPVDWFEPLRAELLAKNPCAKGTSTDSHAWIFLARDVEFPADKLGDPSVFAEWAAPGALQAEHPAGRRVVTVHGDYHPGNMVQHEDGHFQCVDFEFSCVGPATHDLGFAVACCGGNEEKRRVLLTAYLETLGYSAEPAAVDQLTVDAYLGLLAIWHSGGKLAAFCIHHEAPERITALVRKCQAFAREVRASPALQVKLRKERLPETLLSSETFSVANELRASPWIQAAQAALETAEATSTAAAESGAAPANAFVLRAEHDRSKALQVRPGTNRVELGDWDGSLNQMWVAGQTGSARADACLKGVPIEHVHTGLVLDTEVKYCLYERGAPWVNGTELFVRPRDGSERQRWTLEANSGAELVRHTIDGRVLDVNFWDLAPGRGVNVNAAHTQLNGALWYRAGPDGTAPRQLSAPAGSDLEILAARYGWSESIWELEQQGEDPFKDGWKDCMDVVRGMVSGGELHMNAKCEEQWMSEHLFPESCDGPPIPRRLAIRFRYGTGPVYEIMTEAIPEETYAVHITPMQTEPRTTEWLQSATEDATPDAPAREPIVDVPAGAEFLIQPSSAKDFCLAVRADGYTGDSHEVFLARVDAADTTAQRWRLVGEDTIEHVASGRFLHTDVKYAYVRNPDAPWEGNHSNLVTRPQDFSDAQRWRVGPEEFHNGKVLRHFKDGRAVDVHGWNMSDGNNMGCENSCHSDCRGVSYVFTVVGTSRL